MSVSILHIESSHFKNSEFKTFTFNVTLDIDGLKSLISNSYVHTKLKVT